MAEAFRKDHREVAREFGVTPAAGLSAAEVAARQSQYGPNALPADDGVDWARLILSQFTDVMVLVLIVAATVFLVGFLIQGIPAEQMFLIAISLAVAAVPEGLPALDRAEVTQLAGEEAVPRAWDDWTASERVAFIGTAEEGAQFLEAHGEGAKDAGRHLLSQAERILRTIAFTVLAFTQMFQVMAIHAGDQTNFWRAGVKGNPLMFLAVLSTFALQLIVVYMPLFQELFDTRALEASHIFVSVAAGIFVLLFVEVEKAAFRRWLPAAR